VEFRFITGEGRVAQELHQQVTERSWTLYQSECTTRALLRPLDSSDQYLHRALRGKRRKELRRLENRLRETGSTEYRLLGPLDDARPWIESFLELESLGWKGNAGSSLASNESARRFFVETALNAHRNGQLMMLGLFHRGKPIALKCNFISGPGSFAFKIAFDEAYGRYSPGMLLEIENIRVLHNLPQIAWMDSTADAQHFMINRLWDDRRSVETLLISPDRAGGNFSLAVLPFLRWIKRSLRRMFAIDNRQAS
jgi:CelD/BcsL family acetyltransferase involved in cellulose biosynthesis